jgi:hypothetical protein
MKKDETPYLADILKRTLAEDDRLFELHYCTEDEPVLEIDGGPDLYGERGIFDRCSDAEATKILRHFAKAQFNVGWAVQCELAKLTSKRGCLIAELLEPLMAGENWGRHPIDFLLLAYLAKAANGESQILRLLDVVPEDSRDGLFIACWWLDSRAVDRKLMNKFAEGGAGSGWAPGSTGELGALGAFVKRWLDRYPFLELESVIRTYFKYWY